MLPGKLDYLARMADKDLIDRVITSFEKFANSPKPVTLPKPLVLPKPVTPPKSIRASGKLSIQDRARLNSAFRSRYRKSRHTILRNRRHLDKVILGKKR
ncbi:MAG: hypothetical protein CL582_09625 [Alteromonadaceae bacterium]|nr:hypothetical protein [Alteromonadaceae bacterium]